MRLFVLGRQTGRAFSMTRLDQLATPKRRNGEHISAILERERKQALELENLSRMSLSRSSPNEADARRKSRSMTQLGGSVRKSRDNSHTSQDRFKNTRSPFLRKNLDATKSMTQLTGEEHNARKLKHGPATGARNYFSSVGKQKYFALILLSVEPDLLNLNQL